MRGKIIKGVGGSYSVNTQEGIFNCNVRGIFRKKNITPTVGDVVVIDMLDTEEKTATITEIEERKNCLLRPRVSNIDQVILTFAAKDPAINIDLLDKFLLMAEREKLHAVICINKIDLATEESISHLKKTYEAIGYPVLSVSVETGMGFDKLLLLLEGKISVFAGPSGVGKSSIINRLAPHANMETGELSAKIKRGKHTTRHAELLELYHNGRVGSSYLVDSPGFTSLHLDSIEPDLLPELFAEFRPFAQQCRFHNCRHINEPGCVVKEQVEEGISLARYQRYVSISKEISEKR